MTKAERHKLVWRKTHGRCAHCGRYPPFELQTIDHFVPKSVGGTNDKRNLIPLCYDCNQARKSIKINPWKFYRYAPKGVKYRCIEYFYDWVWEKTSIDGYVHGSDWTKNYIKEKIK